MKAKTINLLSLREAEGRAIGLDPHYEKGRPYVRAYTDYEGELCKEEYHHDLCQWLLNYYGHPCGDTFVTGVV